MNLRINNTKIDWLSPHSHYFFNPRHPQREELARMAKKLPFFKAHIYLFTSNRGKIVLLSKSAILNSAKAVNKNLQTQKSDNWLISLPLFHVGGLSILARSFCGGFSFKKSVGSWNAHSFQKQVKEKKISLSSLVPAQIYDLVQNKIKAPKSLRAVIVGGDSLSPLLYKKGRALGWPLLISYGLTEASSQVACSRLSLNKKTFPKMKILSHIEIKQSRGGVKIKSPSLLTANFEPDENKLSDPKDSKGWLKLPDKAILNKNFLLIEGRKEEEIKILGERVDLQKLSFLLEELSLRFKTESYLTAIPDSRRGAELALVSSDFDISKIGQLAKAFNSKVLPFERIRSIYFVSKIKKSGLFKIRQQLLLQQLGF